MGGVEENRLSNPTCRVCGQTIVGGLLYLCPACETPHHADCWKYAGGCSVFGCLQSSALQEVGGNRPERRYSTAQQLLLVSLWIPALACLFIGFAFTMEVPVIAILAFVCSHSFFRKGWQGVIRPLCVEMPVFGTMFCFAMGVTTSMAALLAFIAAITTGLPQSFLIILALSLFAGFMGRETKALFHDLADNKEALPAAQQPVITGKSPPPPEEG